MRQQERRKYKCQPRKLEIAKGSLEAIGKNKGMLVQRYLLEYLLRDEEKHDAILENLEAIKKDSYPYA